MLRWLALVTLIVTAWSSSARADEDECGSEMVRLLEGSARLRFERGQRAMVAKNYRKAAKYFRISLSLSTTTKTLLRLAVVYGRMGDWGRAALFLDHVDRNSAAVGLAVPAGFGAAKKDITRGLKKKRYSPVSLDITPDDATVTVSHFGAKDTFGGTGGGASRTVWLPAGSHVIEVSTAKYAFKPKRASVRVGRGRPAAVRIALD